MQKALIKNDGSFKVEYDDADFLLKVKELPYNAHVEY